MYIQIYIYNNIIRQIFNVVKKIEDCFETELYNVLPFYKYLFKDWRNSDDFTESTVENLALKHNNSKLEYSCFNDIIEYKESGRGSMV